MFSCLRELATWGNGGLRRGTLTVEDGTLRFRTAGSDDLAPGEYGVPFQTVSIIFLEPGSTVSHDALRLLARHGTGLVATVKKVYGSTPRCRLVRTTVCSHASKYESGRIETNGYKSPDACTDGDSAKCCPRQI